MTLTTAFDKGEIVNDKHQAMVAGYRDVLTSNEFFFIDWKASTHAVITGSTQHAQVDD